MRSYSEARFRKYRPRKAGPRPKRFRNEWDEDDDEPEIGTPNQDEVGDK